MQALNSNLRAQRNFLAIVYRKICSNAWHASRTKSGNTCNGIQNCCRTLVKNVVSVHERVDFISYTYALSFVVSSFLRIVHLENLHHVPNGEDLLEDVRSQFNAASVLEEISHLHNQPQNALHLSASLCPWKSKEPF